jgi:hypothetical protein
LAACSVTIVDGLEKNGLPQSKEEALQTIDIHQLDLLGERAGVSPSDFDMPIVPLVASPWIAMSVLQKAIRRGESHLALRAAKSLCENDPKRFWRRMGIMALEEIGSTGVPLFAPKIAAMAIRSGRKTARADWQVAQKLVCLFSKSLKCRMVDDLLMIGKFLPRLDELRQSMVHGNVGLFAEAFRTRQDFEERAVVLLAYHNWLKERGMGQNPDTCHLTYSQTWEPLALLYPLVFSGRWGILSAVDDPMPVEDHWNDIPLWAMDKFTRPGMTALGKFLETGALTAKWINQNCPKTSKIEVLGRMVFAVEGGQMRNRLSWRLSDQLRDTSQRECLGNHCPNASEALALLPLEIPLLNELRLQCLK